MRGMALMPWELPSLQRSPSSPVSTLIVGGVAPVAFTRIGNLGTR